MHTTGQIQAQLHRACSQVTQPLWRRGRKIERNDVGIAQRATHHVLGRQLIVLISQSQQAAPPLLVKACSLDFDTGLGKRFARLIEIRFGDIKRGGSAGDLNSRIIRIEIGRRINDGNAEHYHYQQIFPEGESIEHDAARLMTRGALRAPSLVLSRSRLRWPSACPWAALRRSPPSGTSAPPSRRLRSQRSHQKLW